MARIMCTGGEMGSISGVGDLSTSNASIQTAITRGSWSTYSWLGGTTSLTSAVGEFYLGFGYRNNTSDQNIALLKSPNGTTNLTIDQNNNHFRVLRGTSTVLATGTLNISDSVWYYVELYGVISDTVGKVQLRVNGVDEIALLTSLDTRNDAVAGGDTVDRVNWGEFSQQRFDDAYTNDTTGSQNTGFSGDIRVSAYIPNAAGDLSQLTRGGSDSGNNYGQVDERPPNDVTDYVYGADTTSVDLYNLPNTSGIASVQSATLWIRAAKSDAGAANIATVVKSGGTTDTGSDLTLSTSYQYYRKVMSNDPTDSAAWSTSKIDGLQIGVKSR